jgi:hypothetical protein
VVRTLTKPSTPSGRVNSQLMQCGQKKWRVAPWGPPMTGSPCVTLKAASGMSALREKGAGGHSLTAKAVAGHGDRRRFGHSKAKLTTPTTAVSNAAHHVDAPVCEHVLCQL